MLKKYLLSIYKTATELNHKNIESLFEKKNNAVFLDLGCDDGIKSVRFAGIIGTRTIVGVDIVDAQLEKAKENGVEIHKCNLAELLPFESNSFDVIHANQVIEHMPYIDRFASEILRVLKPGGYVIVSTENGSSWCNIFASIMGWQIFSSTNFSSKKNGIGNPLSLHQNQEGNMESWTHKTIFNYRGLKEFFEAHGFLVENILGAGYFPFPSILGHFDVRHGHFITIKARKQ